METIEKSLNGSSKATTATAEKSAFFSRFSNLEGVFGNFKVRLALFILVDVIFIFNVFYLLTDNFSFGDLFGGSSEITNESVAETINNADAEMGDIANILLLGDHQTADGKKFCFGSDGIYTGYFDAKNTDVTGTYTVKTTSGESTLTITYKNKDVDYSLKYDESSNFLNKLTDKSGKEYVLYEA